MKTKLLITSLFLIVTSTHVLAARPSINELNTSVNQLESAVKELDNRTAVLETRATDLEQTNAFQDGQLEMLDTRTGDLETGVAAQEQVLNILINDLVVCPSNAPTRFVDNGDGTICDSDTGLMWEMKDASDGTQDLTNPHDVDNNYTWTSTGTAPDGTAFTDFLARLNGEIASLPSEQLGGHSDWRLPTLAELQTILDCSFGSPCIDPIFGPTTAAFYWSSTSRAGAPGNAWVVTFSNGGVSAAVKPQDRRVRAVRGGR